MLLQTSTVKSPIPFSFLPHKSPSSIFPPRSAVSLICCCRGTQLSLPTSDNHCNGAAVSAVDRKPKSVGCKNVDIATLGNLCVDVVLTVPELPPKPLDQRKAYMDNLQASPHDKKYWEAGGNCNTAIAAARLGLRCVAIGHVGDEVYGQFLQDVLRDEGIDMVGLSEDAVVDSSSVSYQTLLCWVLVDHMQRHGFCSRADFTKEPAYSWVSELSSQVKTAIRQSKILFINGYAFDELSPSVIVSVLKYAAEVGTAVFLDPGPRGKSLAKGMPEEQRALDQLLKMSDVLLLTSDEAEALTGIQNPVQAGQELLRRGVQTNWVIIKMGAKGSMLITASTISCAPSFKVSVIDTVGCGDSYVAAIAYGYIHNLPKVNTLGLANAVGAATAMGCGAGRNVATLEQVLELMRASNLNDDDKFWAELLDEDFNTEDIRLLSRKVINGNDNKLKHVSLQNVVPELLYKLDSPQLESRLAS